MNEEKKDFDHAWYVKYSYTLLKSILGPLLRLFWIRKVDGLENIPKTGPILMAFNHQSYFDFLCFMAVSDRRIHFLSAEKFFTHTFWGPLMKLTGQIKVSRFEHDKGLLHDIVFYHLKTGKMIGIFPEGTRSPHPDVMLKAFTGVAKFSVTAKVPVIPVGIRGTHEVMSRHAKFPKFKKCVSIHIGKPINHDHYYGKDLTEADFRKITDLIMLEISNLSGKKYPHIGLV